MNITHLREGDSIVVLLVNRLRGTDEHRGTLLLTDEVGIAITRADDSVMYFPWHSVALVGKA